MAEVPRELERAVSEAKKIAKFRERVARDLRDQTRDIEKLTRELMRFSAAVDRKAAEELDGKDADIGARPLTRQEQVKASRMADRMRDLRSSARKLSRVVEEEIKNAERGADKLDGREARDVKSAIRDLERLKSEADDLVRKAEAGARALSRARRRDDLKMLLLKSSGVGAILAVASTVAGATVAGGVIAVAALLAFGVSRIIEEIEKATD